MCSIATRVSPALALFVFPVQGFSPTLSPSSYDREVGLWEMAVVAGDARGLGEQDPAKARRGRICFACCCRNQQQGSVCIKMIKKKCLNKAFKIYFNLGSVCLVDLNCRYLSGLYSIPCLPDFSSLNINHFNKKRMF